jgi:hypothetical protein
MTSFRRSTSGWFALFALSVLWGAVTVALAATPMWIALLRGLASFDTLVSEGRVGPVVTGLAASAAVTAFANHRQWSLGLRFS